ncbi:MAG: S8/S53 family peptidase, partial [Humibacter sp.]
GGRTRPIGYRDSQHDSEVHADVVGPLDGELDPIAGHGTFIAGLIHQADPDSNIVAWRVVEPDGTVNEDELLDALSGVAQLVTDEAKGDGGQRLDVLVLSLGYYHETPQDGLYDITLYQLLAAIGRTGTIVVCSAGNDATDRPQFPAALWDWPGADGDSIVHPSDDSTPIISVGALNPNGTVALFSNDGPWVRTWAPGAAVVSTMPPVNGGLNAEGSRWFEGERRSSIDPDDFRGGFAVWSGTSFAAPVVAGRLAAAIDGLGPATTPEERRARAAKAIDQVLKEL